MYSSMDFFFSLFFSFLDSLQRCESGTFTTTILWVSLGQQSHWKTLLKFCLRKFKIQKPGRIWSECAFSVYLLPLLACFLSSFTLKFGLIRCYILPFFFLEYRGGWEEQVLNSFEADINKNPHESNLCFLDCSLNVAIVRT